MSETTPPNLAPGQLDPGEAELTEPTDPAPHPTPPPAPAPLPGNRPARVLTAIGFLLLAGGLLYVWFQQQQTLTQPAGVDPARLAALEMQVRSLQQRVSQLEQRPAPSPSPPPDLRPLEARMAAAAQQPAAPQIDVGPLLSRIDGLERRATQADSNVANATRRADSAIRIEAAAAALAAGQPLGNIPNAPPALARFASDQPPTEADLRLSFPAAADRAAAASRPATDTQSVTERMWQRVAGLVTVRSGDRVILGAPASVLLNRARERLDAGDLAGAVAALEALDPGAAQAMADWRTRAQSLLDARAALASLAHT